MTDDRQRPAGVPDDARWDGRERAWGIGPGEISRKKIGLWRWWSSDGVYVGEVSYDGKGHTHGPLRRYHPDGRLALEALYDTGREIGTWIWHIPKGTTRDLLPADLELNAGPEIVRIQAEYSSSGKLVNRRFFTEEAETTSKGLDVGIAARVERLTAVVLGSRESQDAAPPFLGSIARIDAWLEGASSLGLTERLIAKFPTLVVTEKHPVARWGRDEASSAMRESIAKIEHALGAELPKSYRDMLMTIGWFDCAGVRAPHPNQLVERTRKHESELHEHFQDMKQYAKLYRDYCNEPHADFVDKPWNEWLIDSDIERILRPDEVSPRLFVPIETSMEDDDDHDRSRTLLALHLRDDAGECPIFSDFYANGQIYLRARNAQAWFAQLVDRAITKMSRHFTSK